MEIFNVKRRDVYDFDNWMDLKKPGFGGSKSAESLKNAKGKDVNANRKLKDYQRKVERHDLFNNQVFDPTYKAMGGDLVHKQEDGKNPYDYPDLYNNMGIAQVTVGKTNEGMCYTDFSSFIIESEAKDYSKKECDDDCDCEDCKEDKKKKGGKK